jgi:hypothetical protein
MRMIVPKVKVTAMKTFPYIRMMILPTLTVFADTTKDKETASSLKRSYKHIHRRPMLKDENDPKEGIAASLETTGISPTTYLFLSL